MKIKFWGCRGSLPASYGHDVNTRKTRAVLEQAIEQKLTKKKEVDTFMEKLPFALKASYGTNTSCVQILGGNEVIICDAGSGIRDLGLQLVKLGAEMPKVINLLISHLHWDHIQGFPFFVPAYIQGVKIKVWGVHDTIEQAFIQQQESPTFPVQLNDMGSEITFHTMDRRQQYDMGGIKIDIIKQPHPGISYGYRFSHQDQIIVYSTDAEHGDEIQAEDYRFIEFFRNADILIFDGQFTLADHLFTKQNWGHSSNLVGIELAIRSGVKKLCLFHSDHTFDDFQLDQFLTDSIRYKQIYDDEAKLDIQIAYDGLEINLDELI